MSEEKNQADSSSESTYLPMSSFCCEDMNLPVVVPFRGLALSDSRRVVAADLSLGMFVNPKKMLLRAHLAIQTLGVVKYLALP